ncbi:hypothetical protein HPB47_014984 [Ixodes persulcatus]|uniref:Uncharacterized protein n=1 Tax=Ixodes persulcatus TaxID=34615 RepID=A0AC60QY74_IXOPE|nr:hypothetical protein HPB47_014984 [Ixodes persulcatus]
MRTRPPDLGIRPATAYEIWDLLFAPPAEDAYKTLKETLIRRVTPSEPQRFQQLLHETELGVRTPSQLLRQRRLLGTRTTDLKSIMLREVFLRRLPTNLRMVLFSPGETNPSKLAELDNRLMAPCKRSRLLLTSSKTPETGYRAAPGLEMWGVGENYRRVGTTRRGVRGDPASGDDSWNFGGAREREGQSTLSIGRARTPPGLREAELGVAIFTSAATQQRTSTSLNHTKERERGGERKLTGAKDVDCLAVAEGVTVGRRSSLEADTSTSDRCRECDVGSRTPDDVECPAVTEGVIRSRRSSPDTRRQAVAGVAKKANEIVGEC